MSLIITIGRENGSGGREIGKRLAKALDIDFYDNNLLDLTAQRTSFDKNYMEKCEEKAPGLWAVFALGGPLGAITPPSTPDSVYQEQTETIRQVAEKGSCVIVGRTADYVLRDMKTINIFVHAPIEERVLRKMALMPREKYQSAQTLQKQIAEADKVRSRFYSYYTGLEWGPGPRFDLCIDTSKVGIDGAVETILAYIKARKENHPLATLD